MKRGTINKIIKLELVLPTLPYMIIQIFVADECRTNFIFERKQAFRYKFVTIEVIFVCICIIGEMFAFSDYIKQSYLC